MQFARPSVLAVLASLVLGSGAAGACETADLAGDWFATYQHGASGYCTLSIDATGAVTTSGCWLEKIKTTPQFVLTGAFAVDEVCGIAATLTPASAGSSFAPAAKAAKAVLAKSKKGHGKGGHGKGGDKVVTLSGRLLTGAELANGILTSANGEFSPVTFTRLK